MMERNLFVKSKMVSIEIAKQIYRDRYIDETPNDLKKRKVVKKS